MALQIRKLSQEEATKAFPRRGQMDLSEYVDGLRGLQPGDAAEVHLGSLSARALKRRIGQAAKQLGYALRWSRESGGNSLRFQVRDTSQTRARNGRRGRRKKTAE